MAQAARLSMRMQKEVKLLLSDPPHGASFPSLSSAAAGSGDLSTFSTIDAQIKGPEDTVYANGIFNVKIQIPERYPFQPPVVAFATPIYHPNIDNSGRICLDILNLPPKGAWQPSLNISTVLTSIGLLLSEPNPDDGLMCEVSKEFKYNRQAFDYKAREMTDKYAKVKPDGSNASLQIQESSNSGEKIKSHGDDEKISERGKSVLAGNHENPDEIKLESSKSILQTKDVETAAKGGQLLLSSCRDHQQEDGNGKRKAVVGFCEGNNGIKTSRKKLSLALPPQSQKKGSFGEESRHGVSPTCKEYTKPDSDGKKKLSLGLKQPCEEERDISKVDKAASVQTSINKNEALEMKQNQDAKSWRGKFENSGLEEALMPESIVVLDSDDSGEEEQTVSSRSKLSLARRGLKCSRP